MQLKWGDWEFHLDAATIIALIYVTEYMRRRIKAMTWQKKVKGSGRT